jgi:hypothetical protein
MRGMNIQGISTGGMNMIGKSKSAIYILLIILALFACCSEKITYPTGEESELSITVSPGASVNLGQVSRFTLTITGPGIIEPIKTSLVFQNGVLITTEPVRVQAGPDRVFLIQAFDETGNLIYSGRTVTDIEPDKTVELKIDLHPVIPMIKLSPLYYFDPFGSLLAFKVKVYSMPALQRIRIKIDNICEAMENHFYADSVVLNPAIVDTATLSWWNTEIDPAVMVDISCRYPQSSIIDESGYRELATVYYQTYYPTGSPSIQIYQFSPQIIAMVDLEGDTLSGEDIYGEEATAELFDARIHRVGYWKMDWESEDEDSVRDYSGNHLHGIASGTTWDEGIWGSARVFDGIDDYIQVPDHALLDLDEGITVSFWANILDYGKEDTASTIISKMSRNGPINYQCLLSGLAGEESYSFFFGYGELPYQAYYVDVSDTSNAQWRNIIFSYQFGDPSSAILVLHWSDFSGDHWERIEGKWFEGAGYEQPPLSDGPLTFGKQLNTEYPFHFDGGLDEVELYDVSMGWEAIHYVFSQR